MKVVCLLFLVAVAVFGDDTMQFSSGTAETLAVTADNSAAAGVSAQNTLGAVPEVQKSAANSAELAKIASGLGPAYIAINQALGPRTQAYVNNWFQALGYGPLIGFFRNLYAASGRAQYITFVRQYAALFGGASGYQLATFVRAFSSPADYAQWLAVIYKDLGAPGLVFQQQLTISTGGRSTQKPAKLAKAINDVVGVDAFASTLSDLLSAVNSKPKVLGALIGQITNGLNFAQWSDFIANNFAGSVDVVTAAVNKGTSGPFDFTGLSSFTAAKAAAIIINVIKTNNYF